MKTNRKKIKHRKKSGKVPVHAYYPHFIIALAGFLLAILWLMVSTNITAAKRYTPYPTPVPPGGATPIPVPTTGETDIRFTNPKDNDTVVHNSWVSINTVAIDREGITYMEIYADGTLLCQGNTSSLGCSWRAGRAGTIHLLEVKSTDTFGNNAATSIRVTSK